MIFKPSGDYRRQFKVADLQNRIGLEDTKDYDPFSVRNIISPL